MLFREPNPQGRPARSFVDLPTNAGLIGALSTAADVGKFMAGRLPRGVLPSVLHEATHHWCFSAPLGVALALLFQRAGARLQQAALAGPGAHPENEALNREAMADARRYEAAVHLLEPLAEGLALFCEFDLRSRSRDVLPAPLAHAAHLFLDLASKPAATVEELMARLEVLLCEMGAHPDLAQRKTAVLLGSITPSANPYLAGYLSVRWAWSSAAYVQPALADAQAFFVYLRHYVFCDLELVRLLLEADADTFNTAFPTRLRDRLMQLHTGHAPAPETVPGRLLQRIDAFGWTMEAMVDAELIGLDTVDAVRGLATLRDALAALQQRADAGGSAGRIWSAVLGWLGQRDAFVLDCSDVHVAVRAGGFVTVRRNANAAGPPFLYGRAPDKAAPVGEGIGHAVMLVAGRSLQRYFAVCYADHVVAEATSGGVADDDERAWLRELALDVVRKQTVGQVWHQSLVASSSWLRGQLVQAGALGPGSGVSHARPPIHENLGPGDDLARASDTLYGTLALPPGLAAGRRDAALDALRNAGIAAFFPRGTARTFMPVVVGWSLGGCTDQQLDNFLGDERTLDKLDAAIAAVNAQARACWGVDLIALQDGRVLCTAV